MSENGRGDFLTHTVELRAGDADDCKCRSRTRGVVINDEERTSRMDDMTSHHT